MQLTPCALVLDDAHSGIQEVRDSFSLRIEVGDLYDQLLQILRPGCKEHHPGQWAGIERKDAAASLEVPFWVWTPMLDDVRQVLEAHGNDAPYVFVWGYLRDHLRWCRCVISGRGIEIFLDVPAVHLVRPYKEAEHRVFMSRNPLRRLVAGPRVGLFICSSLYAHSATFGRRHRRTNVADTIVD